MAASELRISASASRPSSGNTLMPIEGVTVSSRPSRTMGSDSVSMIFCATWAESAPILISGSTTTNSSPPTRHTVSPSRSCLTRRAATSLSSRSPTACPRESLMVLNRSRSMNITAVCLRLRYDSASAWVSRSSSRRRFGRPVRASWSARCWARCSADLRSAISASSRAFADCNSAVRSATARSSSLRERSSASRAWRSAVMSS